MRDAHRSAPIGPLLPTTYDLAWALVALVVLLVLAAVVVVLLRAVRESRCRSTSERLAELDALLAAGAVTQLEHADARRAVLRG